MVDFCTWVSLFGNSCMETNQFGVGSLLNDLGVCQNKSQPTSFGITRVFKTCLTFLKPKAARPFVKEPRYWCIQMSWRFPNSELFNVFFNLLMVLVLEQSSDIDIIPIPWNFFLKNRFPVRVIILWSTLSADHWEKVLSFVTSGSPVVLNSFRPTSSISSASLISWVVSLRSETTDDCLYFCTLSGDIENPSLCEWLSTILNQIPCPVEHRVQTE